LVLAIDTLIKKISSNYEKENFKIFFFSF